MPTLQELKDKWFIDGNTEFIEAYPPDTNPPLIDAATFDDIGLNFRHTGTALLNHTDGNKITILGEGKTYMEKWYDLITDPNVTTVYNTNWIIDNVQTKQSVSTSTALDTLIQVASGSASVYQFADGNLMSFYANIPSNIKLILGGVISTGDYRFPAPAGSNHQKFMIVKTSTTGWALVGSIDITVHRLDDETHSGTFEKITHDFGVMVEGPVVSDIEKTFVERWNDSSRDRHFPYFAMDPPQPPIINPIGTYAPAGSHSIQVLRTYGLGKFTYSWADSSANPPEKGEFSIWASTLNAIKKAQSYIYIEDQTFLTLGWPARCDDIFNPARQVVDLIYQLGEALKRNVRVGIIVSKKGANPYETFQRHYSLNFLSNIASANGSNFFVGYIDNGSEFIYLHSKLFLVDDEFVLIGSANFDQRSMTHDSELKLGVVDENNVFVKELRSALYAEHSELPTTNFDDPIQAFDDMKQYVDPNTPLTGRLRNYDFSNLSQPYMHAKIVNGIGWPYAGPLNLK